MARTIATAVLRIPSAPILLLLLLPPFFTVTIIITIITILRPPALCLLILRHPAITNNITNTCSSPRTSAPVANCVPWSENSSV